MQHHTDLTVDVLAVGAHPDDVEIGIGGFMSKLARHGLRTGILDLTEGEMSTRGTVEERRQEADDAACVLGAVRRENACLPDAGLANTTEFQRRVIPYIRSFRPRVLIAPMAPDRHPDHAAAHELMRDANFFSGLARIDSDHPPHRTPVVYYYQVHGLMESPTFIADISDDFDTKLEALRAHRSQFHNPEYQGPATYISSTAFWESIRNRAAWLGSRISAAYGEGLFALEPVAVNFPPGLEGSPCE